MDTLHLLDPELHPITESLPPFDLSDELLPVMRELIVPPEIDDPPAGVTRREITIPGPDGEVRCLLYEPAEPAGGGYLHLHGGGFVMGAPETSDPENAAIAQRLGAVVLSVAYRLAPEHPAPAGIDDAYAALAWLHENAESLGVDRDRIAIGGESAGGGVCAALAIVARDRGEYAVCHQQLTYPMLDHRTGSDEQPGDPLVGEFVWTRGSNRYGWSAYLGGQKPASPVVPALVDSYEGLPPTWLFTAALDLFRDEDIAFAHRLLVAGVPTELTVTPGACHGFQFVPGTAVLDRYRAAHLDALRRALT